MKILKNSVSQMPKRYYGLHMVEGVAEYPEHKNSDGKPSRILVLENTLKAMDPTFEGRPLYVHHVDNVDISKLPEEADGYVIKSFFNQFDGKHWVEFLGVTDDAHTAIRNGWKLSNAYMIKETGGAGQWHAVSYNQEVRKGVYTHLAIVPNPRYAESIILTPEEFKAYNSRKEQELKSLANSKGERKMGLLKLFKKAQPEDSASIEEMVVQLCNGTEKSIKSLVEDADATIKAEEARKNSKEPVMANMEHAVKVGDCMMSVNELLNKYMGYKNAEDEKAKKEAADKEAAEKEKQNALAKEAKEKADKEAADKAAKEAEQKRFEELKNAHLQNEKDKAPDLMMTGLERGKERYGSGKK